MEENVAVKSSVISVGVKYGLILSLVSVVYFLALVLSGQNAFDNKWSWLSVIFSIGIMILGHKAFKDEGNGFMSFGQGVGVGFWISLVSVIVGGIFTFVYSTMIDPAVMDLFFDKQMEDMQAKNMPDDQIEMAVSWTKKLFWPMYIFFGVFFGVLIALIVSIFTQKKYPQPTF